MNEPRSAAALGREFPYKLPTMCYIELTGTGDLLWGADEGTYERVRSGESRLYAVWPGKWSSHLFAIDDLDEYARGLGIEHDEERTGLADHVHDVVCSMPTTDNGAGTYVSIEVALRCGCEINDIRAFAKQMRVQKGWDVATSAGWSSSWNERDGRTYRVRVRRRSL